MAAAGSLGRLEAGPESDFDSLFFAPGTASEPVLAAMQAVYGAASRRGLVVPKPGGIFRAPVDPRALTDRAALGRLDEAPGVFGPRIQLLLDARPVSGRGAFGRLRRQILTWYCAPSRRLPGEPLWAYLHSDLVRYVHAYRNWQLLKPDANASDSWALRQAKLLTVRYVTWMGLFLLMMRAREHGPAGSAWFVSHLDQTPIERIAGVIGTEAARLAEDLVETYVTGLALLHDPAVRQNLVATPMPRHGKVELPAHCREFRQLGEALRALVGEFLARRSLARGIEAWQGLPF